MINYKEKYLKYKTKYLTKKYNQEIILDGGSHIFDDIKTKNKIDEYLGSFRWNIKTILIDCIRDIKTQEKTSKQIQYIIDNDYIEYDNKEQINWALVYAVKLGLPYITNTLLLNGANPNFIDQYNMSLVEYAIDESYVKTLNYLIERGANISDELQTKRENMDKKNLTEQSDFVDQVIFGQEINIKIYNGIKNILNAKNKIKLNDINKMNIQIE